MFNLNMAAWKTIDKMFHVYGGLNCQRSSPVLKKQTKENKKNKLQRDVRSERGREMCIDTPRSQQHIKAQLQPRPLLQCVEINWVKKICCLRLKWVMGGSVTIVFCLPEAIYRSFRLSLFSVLNTCLPLSLSPSLPSLLSPSIHLLSLSCSLLSFFTVILFPSVYSLLDSSLSPPFSLIT